MSETLDPATPGPTPQQFADDKEAWAVQRMIDLGWLPPEGPGPNFSFAAALIEYQQWAELPVSGKLDEATYASLQALRFCGFPDRMVVGEARLAPLPALWEFRGTLPSVPTDQARAEIQRSFDKIARVCPAWGREARPGEQPTVVITATRIDGRNGVLADMYLPGPMPQHGRVDTSEIYVIAVAPSVPAGRIGLGHVMTHELIHWAGVGHLQTPNSLMNPIYTPAIDSPQAADVRALQGLYPGSPYLPTPPVDPVPPGQTPVPPGESLVTMRIHGARKIEVEGYDVIKKRPVT